MNIMYRAVLSKVKFWKNCAILLNVHENAMYMNIFILLFFICDLAGVSQGARPNLTEIFCPFIEIPFTNMSSNSEINGSKNSFKGGLESPHHMPTIIGLIFGNSVYS